MYCPRIWSSSAKSMTLFSKKTVWLVSAGMLLTASVSCDDGTAHVEPLTVNSEIQSVIVSEVARCVSRYPGQCSPGPDKSNAGKQLDITFFPAGCEALHEPLTYHD